MNNNQFFLFDIPNIPIKKIKTCKNCGHRQRWECGTKIIQYCVIRKSNRTCNGLLKISTNKLACKYYFDDK